MASGLDGIVVAQTVLSEVDGSAGKLIVRGHPIEALTGRVSYERMVGLLWDGLVDLRPAPATDGSLDAALGRARVEVFSRLGDLLPHFRPHLDRPPRGGHASPPEPPAAMAALRWGLAGLRPGETGTSLLVTAAMPVLVAAFDRRRHGLAPLAPDPAAGHAADFLTMLRGAPPAPAEAAALDAYLVTVAEHGMNASTFAARVVASTGAGVLPAVIAALSALEGPLHGGAPGPVLDMLDALAAHADRRAWLRAEIAAGRRLMGFGHRIYRVRDPRADVLREQVDRLRSGSSARLALAESVERDALTVLAELHPERRLDTNVEYYTALLLDALGIHRALFTSVFAIGRAAGWCAHVAEQERSGRLIRPQSEYIGPRPRAA